MIPFFESSLPNKNTLGTQPPEHRTTDPVGFHRRPRPDTIYTIPRQSEWSPAAMGGVQADPRRRGSTDAVWVPSLREKS